MRCYGVDGSPARCHHTFRTPNFGPGPSGCGEREDMASASSRMAADPTRGPATIDPVTFEVLKNAVDSILDEMSLTIVRTAYSTIIRDAMDFATSFFDADGQLLAQGLSIPFHLGGMPDALAAVRRRLGDRLEPGDV